MTKELNPEQKQVVAHRDGPLAVLAVAGSGKTEALVSRVAELVRSGIDPSRILAVTFSKNGADEMNRRLERLLGNTKARVGTFHSVGYQILRTHTPHNVKLEVQDAAYALLVKKLVSRYKKEGFTTEHELLMSFIGRCKGAVVEPGTPEALLIAAELREKYGDRARPKMLDLMYTEAEQQRQEGNIITFDDMLYDAVRMLRSNDAIRERWATRWDYIIQDEAQDQNNAQHELARIFASRTRNYCVIGDPQQCHPPGTLILRPGGAETAIDKLFWNSKVVAWQQSSQVMLERGIKIARRRFVGQLYTITAGGCSVQATPNHLFVARWRNRHVTDCVTYLMWRRDMGFRVGWCQLFQENGNFHLSARARMEFADRVWILKVHKDRTQASAYESIVAAQYGIPTVMFEPRDNTHYTASVIQQIFDAVGPSLQARGARCLVDHNKYFEYPLYPWPSMEDKTKPAGRRTVFLVHTANVEPALMCLPKPPGKSKDWFPVETVAQEPYDGPVYSLDVEKDHTYVANGLIVHNCLYGFRGARETVFTEFVKEFDAPVIRMERNYRSGAAILELAQKVLREQELDAEGRLICEQGDRIASVEGWIYDSPTSEAQAIARQIKLFTKLGTPHHDIAVLIRAGIQSVALESVLMEQKIPYHLAIGSPFYKRRDVATLLSYLRLACHTETIDDWELALKRPTKYLTLTDIDNITAAAKVATFDTKTRQIIYNTKGRDSRICWRNAFEWADVIDSVLGRENDRADKVLTEIVARTNYLKFLHEEGDIGLNDENLGDANQRLISELLSRARHFTVAELLKNADDTLQFSTKQLKAKDKITVTTIHRAKGLEWPVVFLPGVTPGFFPSNQAKPKEEARVFYVGVTRAMNKLIVSGQRGGSLGGDKVLSPFLELVPELRDASAQAEDFEAAEIDGQNVLASRMER